MPDYFNQKEQHMSQEIVAGLLKKLGEKAPKKEKKAKKLLKAIVTAKITDGEDVSKVIDTEEELAVLKDLGFEIEREEPEATKKTKGKAKAKKDEKSKPKKDEKKAKKAKDPDRIARGSGKKWLVDFWEKNAKKQMGKKDIVAAYTADLGEKSRWTCENYLAQAKRDKDLLGFMLHEAKIDGVRTYSRTEFPKSVTDKAKKAKAKAEKEKAKAKEKAAADKAKAEKEKAKAKKAKPEKKAKAKPEKKAKAKPEKKAKAK